MIRYGTRSAGLGQRREIPAFDISVFKSEWMDSGRDAQRSPTVTLIEQPPGQVLQPHFHRQNQFQLFIEGSGRIGARALDGVTIHYAGAYTGYGPLAAGPEGLKYFTIRPVFETGANLIRPGDRTGMLPGPKRSAHGGPVDTGAALEPAPGVQTQVLIPSAPDGLGALALSIAPGCSHTVPVPAASDCTFALVLDGEMSAGERTLGHWESIAVNDGDPLPPLVAGSEGVRCVVLFTPPKDPAYV